MNSRDDSTRRFTADHQPLGDEAERIRLTSGNAELARRLLDMLLAELPHHRDRIARAVRDKDLPRTRTEAHTLAGGAAYCAVPALKSAADALEHAAGRGNFDQTLARFEDLCRAIEALLATSLALHSESGR